MIGPTEHLAEITAAYMNRLEEKSSAVLLDEARQLRARHLTAYGARADKILLHQRAREVIVALRETAQQELPLGKAVKRP